MTMQPYKATLEWVPAGKAGTRVVLRKMSEFVKQYKTNRVIRELAIRIVRNNVPGKDWVGEAKAIQNWVRDNIRYTRDVEGVETIQTPVKTLEYQSGDCDDHSILVAALLASIGHPTRFIAVAFRPGSFSHVLTQTKIGPRWISLETTQNWPAGKFPARVVERMIQNNRIGYF